MLNCALLLDVGTLGSSFLEEGFCCSDTGASEAVMRIGNLSHTGWL